MYCIIHCKNGFQIAYHLFLTTAYCCFSPSPSAFLRNLNFSTCMCHSA
jgi:hypothetical protein